MHFDFALMRKYVYMLSQNPAGIKFKSRKGRGSVVCSTQIGWTSNPLRRLKEHNRVPGFKLGKKTTQAGAPYWQLEIVIGGMQTGLTDFCDNWRKNSRKLERRIAYGIQYAVALHRRRMQLPIVIWARDPEYAAALARKHSTTEQTAAAL